MRLGRVMRGPRKVVDIDIGDDLPDSSGELGLIVKTQQGWVSRYYFAGVAAGTMYIQLLHWRVKLGRFCRKIPYTCKMKSQVGGHIECRGRSSILRAVIIINLP